MNVATSTAELRRHLERLDGDPGTILLPPGRYAVDETIELHNGVAVYGAGKATALVLADGANADLFCLPPGSDWCQLRNLHLVGNRTANESGSGVRVSGSTYGVQLGDLIVDRFADHGVVSTGGSDRLSYEAHLENVQSKENGRTGFTFEYMTDLYAGHIYAESNGEEGIVDYTSHNTYWHPHAYDNADGMRISQYSSHIDLYCPHFENNDRRGCLLKGDDCVLVGGQNYCNNGEGADPSVGYDALEIDGGTGNSVIGGAYYDDRSTPTQCCGIRETGDAKDNRVDSVHTSGNVEGGVELTAPTSTHDGVTAETAPADQPQADHAPGTVVWFTDSESGEGSGLYFVRPDGEPVGPLDG